MPSFKPPQQFNFREPQGWPEWRSQFQRFRTASELSDKSGEVQVSSLIYYLVDTSTADCHRALHQRQRFSSAHWKRSLQERSMLCVSSMTSWCSLKTKKFTKNTWRTPWKNWTAQTSSWTKRSVSFVSRRFTFWALSSTKMAWKQTQGKPRQSSKCLTLQTLPSYAFFGYGQLPRSIPSESVYSSPASHRTPREGQSVDVGAASGQCCCQSQRDVDFCSNTCLLRSRQGYNSECRCEQLWAWCSSFARAPRWTPSCCLRF